MLVTIGPEYGSFTVKVDGQETELSYPEISLGKDGEYLSEQTKTSLFDAVKISKAGKIMG